MRSRGRPLHYPDDMLVGVETRDQEIAAAFAHGGIACHESFICAVADPQAAATHRIKHESDARRMVPTAEDALLTALTKPGRRDESGQRNGALDGLQARYIDV